MTRALKTALAALIVIGLLAAVGCASSPQAPPKVKRPCPVDLLALAPFMAAQPVEEGHGVVCPITKEIHTGIIPTEAQTNVLTRALPQELEAFFGCKTVSPGHFLSYLPGRIDGQGRPVRQALASAARKVKAQAVLAGTLFRYRDRQGSGLGVNKPASIYFGLYLINAQTGRIVWQGFFNETQESLSENLLKAETFFSRGGKWITADQLARFGLRQVISRMPSSIGD